MLRICSASRALMSIRGSSRSFAFMSAKFVAAGAVFTNKDPGACWTCVITLSVFCSGMRFPRRYSSWTLSSFNSTGVLYIQSRVVELIWVSLNQRQHEINKYSLIDVLIITGRLALQSSKRFQFTFLLKLSAPLFHTFGLLSGRFLSFSNFLQWETSQLRSKNA